MHIPKTAFASAILLLSLSLQAQIDQDLVDDFALKFSYSNKIPLEEVKTILDQAVYQQSIIEKIQKPAEGMPWYKYRNIFITDERIKAGVEFWNQHEKLLAEISQQYSVDAEVIIGIIGVESYFGTRKGDYRVLDALYTLAFGYPRRAKFFRSELSNFLLLAKKENLDVYNIKGSYAGAMGYGQFMPSSYEAYAKSYDNDNSRDLVNSIGDAMASVANYLKVNGWEFNHSTAVKAKVGPNAQKVAGQPLKPQNYTSYYADLGFSPSERIDPGDLVTLQQFETEDGEEFWFGTKNFYVITRYNRSSLYALAVHQLAEAVKNAVGN